MQILLWLFVILASLVLLFFIFIVLVRMYLIIWSGADIIEASHALEDSQSAKIDEKLKIEELLENKLVQKVKLLARTGLRLSNKSNQFVSLIENKEDQKDFLERSEDMKKLFNDVYEISSCADKKTVIFFPYRLIPAIPKEFNQNPESAILVEEWLSFIKEWNHFEFIFTWILALSIDLTDSFEAVDVANAADMAK